MNPFVKILILNWNGSKVLKPCLESIVQIDYDNYSTVVIDNASSDDSCTMVEKEFPDIQLFKLDVNYGFSKGYNKYFKSNDFNDSKFILLLNNDTIVEKNILNNFINATYKFGINQIYGAKIFYLNNKKKIWYAGGIVNFKKGMIYHKGIRKRDSMEFSNPERTDYITGCCLFTSNEVINKLNGFDEDFNMYGEDVDLCMRAKKENFFSFYIPSVKIFHHVSWSMGGIKKIIKFLKKINSFIKLYKKHYLNFNN